MESHDIETFSDSDESTISLKFKLNKSLPKNFQSSLLCARNSEGQGACPGDSGGKAIYS